MNTSEAASRNENLTFPKVTTALMGNTKDELLPVELHIHGELALFPI